MDTNARFTPKAGVLEFLEKGIRRILAPNPSPMTFRGTNTYIVGIDHQVIIDPGPDDQIHLEAILRATSDHTIDAIFVTHSHLDHSPLARPLAEQLKVPIYAYGNSLAGRSDIMVQIAESGLSGGGEGVDPEFEPDICLSDKQTVNGAGWSIHSLWTPGHFGNHMCFSYNSALFSGDHVMGWASSLVSPPDGDLRQFMDSCKKLLPRKDTIFYPAHGAPISDPQSRLQWLISHRKKREQSILEQLGTTPKSIEEITRQIYCETPPSLLLAAQRNVYAHLIDLISRNKISSTQNSSFSASFYLVKK